MSSHLTYENTFTANGNINQDPACTNQGFGYYTRTGTEETTPYSNVRQLRVRWYSNNIYDIDDGIVPEINPPEGFTVQDDGSLYFNQVVLVPSTYRGSSYGWDSTGSGICGSQAAPNGDWVNAFDLDKYSSNINASVELDKDIISLGEEITLTYYTAADAGVSVSGSRFGWQRSTQNTSGTYSYNTYTFTPGADQTDYYIQITDSNGNTIRDSAKLTIIGAPVVTISSDAPVIGIRNRVLLGNSFNLTGLAETVSPAYIEKLKLEYPWPNPTTTIESFPTGQQTSFSRTVFIDTPLATTNYRVTATDNYDQETSRTYKVFVDDPPAPTVKFFVDSFQGDKTINIGESISLLFYLQGNYVTSMYYTDGTNTTNYTNGDEQLIQSVTLTPTVTTTYTVGGEGLGAYNATLTSTPVSRTVTVISDPPLPYISANPTTIVSGGDTTITFGAQGTTIDSMSLSYPGTTLNYTDGTERTHISSPTTTTTYTCSASNNAGSGDDATVEVIVLTPPTGSLTVDQSTTCPGTNRTFTFTVTGDFDSAEVLNPNGTQAVSFNFAQTSTFSSSVAGTYTLNVYAGYGEGIYDVVKTVSLTELVPTTADLVGTGVTIYSGSSVTLAWYVQGSGVQVSINNGIGIVDQNSYINVSPTEDTTYTLTAGGTCNTATDTFTVTVLPAPPSSANPTLTADPLTLIEGESTKLEWSSSDRDISAYTLTDVPDPGANSPVNGYLVYPTTNGQTYTYTVTTTYTSLSYTNTNTFVGWISPGVPCPTGYWKCGNNLPTPSGLFADKCCQSVNTTSTTVDTESDSVSITVYEIPELTLTVLPTSTMTVGEERTLEWSVSGDANVLVWVSPTLNPPTNTNLTSNTIVEPLVTTTYSAYPTGLGGIGSTESVTITVYQIPTLSVTWPELVDYGSQALIEYTSQYTNGSLTLTPTYYYLDGTTVVGDTVDLSRASSAEFGIGTTEVTDQYTTEIPWSNRGAMTIVYFISGTGSGGIVSDSHTLIANVDITPVNINILDNDGLLADQEPVITPGTEQLSSQYLIDDIDVDVEIKSNFPIQVQLNNDGTWENVRQL